MSDDQDLGEKYQPGARRRPRPLTAPPPDDTFDGDLETWCAWRSQNDLGNGERLLKRFGEDLLYVPEAGWFGWCGRRWDHTTGEDAAHKAAQKTVKALYAEAAALEKNGKTDDDRVGLAMKWARESGSSGRIAAMQKEARPHLTVPFDDLDRSLDLFTCASGTLELGPTVIERPHDRADRVTRLAPVDFEDATAPVFHAFLEKILPAPEMRAFVQRWFGYCLTGDTSEQVMAFLLGTGSNGKSTLLNCITHVMGDYALGLPIKSLLKDDRGGGGSGPSPDLARLPGARLVVASEPEVGDRLSESIVKQLTGGEKMTVRHLNRDFFEFKPQFTLTVSANNRPVIRGADDGIWRRILLVDFPAKVDREDVIEVYAALSGEAPGILGWLVQGYEAWRAGGLGVPPQVRVATDAYRAESDPIGRFLKEWAHLGADVTGRTKAGELYAAYKLWCREYEIEALTQNLFGRRLADRGMHKEKVGIVYYDHVVLTEEARKAMADDARGGLDQGTDDGPPAGHPAADGPD